MRVTRNEPCPCGSGRKYKKCCLLRARADRVEEVNRTYVDSMSLSDRNVFLLGSIREIFEFDRNDWDHVKRCVVPDRVRELYLG